MERPQSETGFYSGPRTRNLSNALLKPRRVQALELFRPGQIAHLQPNQYQTIQQNDRFSSLESIGKDPFAGRKTPQSSQGEHFKRYLAPVLSSAKRKNSVTSCDYNQITTCAGQENSCHGPLELINEEYEALERNLKNLNFKKQEQSLREADLVKMTKKCKIKTNELKKKEDYLRLKQKKVQEGDDYWRKKKDKIREQELKNQQVLAELSLKAETVEDRVLDLEEKSQKISALDVELRKKLEVYDQRQRDLNERVRSYNQEREEFDDHILINNEEFNEYINETQLAKVRLEREQRKQKASKEQVKDLEVATKTREEDLTNQTLELEKKNQRLQIEKQWQREKVQSIEFLKRECQQEEEVVKQMRLQVSRRKETIAKKELNIMVWAKRNQQEKVKTTAERRALEDERTKLLAEEKHLNESLRQQKRREFDELAKKGRIVEAKKEQNRKLKGEQDKLSKECLQIEQEIRVMDVVIKGHMDSDQNIELKMMGLELSEEVWRKKWQEQQKFMLDEKQRLDDLEQELLTREGKLDPGSKNHRKKSLSSKPKKWPRGRVGRSTNDILDNKENMSLIDNQ